MNIFAIGPFIVSLLTLCFGVFIYLKNKKAKLNRLFCLLCISVFIWAFGYSQMYNTKTNNSLALFWARFGYCGVVFIPVFTYHYIITFLKLKRRKLILYLVYALGITFLFISRTNLFLHSGYTYFWGYYPKAGPLYIFFVLFFAWIFVRVAALLFFGLKYKKLASSPIEVNRIKYVLLGFAIATTSLVDYVPNYGIEIYPWAYLSALGWLICMGWASFRYRLMDINVALTRAGVFIVVYSLVLGVPFWLGYVTKLWLPATSLAVLFATLGPFIYIYISHRAEERLLKEQRRYQSTLKQASVGMTRIRNLRKLLDLITHIVTKTVKIAYAGIYLYNQETNEFVLQLYRDKGRMPVSKLTPDNPLISYITVNRQPLVYEEIKRLMEDNHDATYKHLEENMRLLTASVVIPSFLEDRFLGFFVLGEKTSGQIYTPDDLNVFQVLAAQAALAIENARFFEETKQMQEQIATAEKMATIGTMADGLSHQINNRFYALSLIAADTIDTIKMTNTSNCSPEVKEAFNQIAHALERVKANVMQGGEVVKGMLKYTRKGEEGLEALTLDQILDSTLEMVQYKVKLSEIDIIRNYPKDHPKIRGNSVQLQEAFFNFIDNGYDSTVERKTILKEPNYRGRLIFSAQSQQENGMLLVTIEDNGMGIKEEDKKKLFTPFFTTKVSSRLGTGLGLYVLRRVIEEFHKGKIWFASEYGKGTRFFLQLPIAKE